MLELDIDLDNRRWDTVSSTGDMTLGGTLVLNIHGDDEVGGYDIPLFSVDEGATLSLNFADIVVNGYFEPTYWSLAGIQPGGNGVLTYNGVPEPAAWALMALGLAALGFRQRRSCRR